MKTVLLFDLDGVLVEPRGYRAAVSASLKRTFARWGWALAVPPDLPEHFEAAGITSEWDMVPLTLAAALNAWAEAHGRVPPPEVLEPRGAPPPVWGNAPLPDFAAVPRLLAPHLQRGVAPAEVAWRLQSTPSAAFPALGQSPLARALLAETRSLNSPTTRLFQQLALGSELFAKTYGLPAEVKSPSLLKEHDKPLLSAPTAERLRRALAEGQFRAAVLTARPSHPPDAPPELSYSPEAELALAAAGLESLPVIGFGHLNLFARRGFGDGERLLKPAAFHALAALFAALGFRYAEAMQSAALWALEGEPRPELLPPDGVHLVVVEDTSTGLRSVLGAAELLRAARLPVQTALLGVATHPAKRRSLEQVGARVFTSTDEALGAILLGKSMDYTD